VTIYVGPDLRPFTVHKAIIAEASKFFGNALNGPFKGSADNGMKLEEDDPEAFALLLRWLYTGSLPAISNHYIVYLPFRGFFSSVSVQRALFPSTFTPGVYGALFGEMSADESLQHIAAIAQYKNLSQEELRLLDEAPKGDQWALRYLVHLQGDLDHPDEKTTAKKPKRPIHSRKKVSKETLDALHSYMNDMESIPVGRDIPPLVEAEFFQLTLIKLMIMAEMYDCVDLFNDAMDAYRKSEREMGRESPLHRHVDLAYAWCHRKSPLVTLMADRVFFSGKLFGTQNKYKSVALKHPDFLEDIMLRNDAQVQVPGYFPHKERVDPALTPLTLNCGSCYHIHDTKPMNHGGTCTDANGASRILSAGEMSDAKWILKPRVVSSVDKGLPEVVCDWTQL
jgi:hypothetical protein